MLSLSRIDSCDCLAEFSSAGFFLEFGSRSSCNQKIGEHELRSPCDQVFRASPECVVFCSAVS
jgi:hypothetical protein